MEKDQFFTSGLLKKYLLGIANPIECAKIAALLEINPDWKNQVELLENKFREWVKIQNASFTKNNQNN
jgi:hypothetical protein